MKSLIRRPRNESPKRLGKRLATLALPVVAAMALGFPASAAPNTTTQVLVAEAGDTSSASGAAVSPQALTSYISNENDIGIGVSQNNTPPLYEAILPGHRRTDGSPLGWDHAYSFYIGPGYCADAWYWQNNGWRFDPRNTVKGSKEAQIVAIPGEAVARWAVRNVRVC
ncbi:hypothetical protein [Streptomyces phaeochromogenes]|uniref:hypothetical protein n=1 Tax=Streptomyces phaeochromogenes TaxID=1923 RepID=UPI0036BAA8DF